MKAFVLPALDPVAPWGDAASELEVFGTTLREWRRRVLAGLGFDVVELDAHDAVPAGAPCLVIGGHVLPSRAAITALVRSVGSEPRNRVLALPDCAFVRFTTPLMNLRAVEHAGRTVHCYDVFWVQDGRVAPLDFEQFEPLVLEPKEKAVPSSAPPFVPGERVPIGITASYLFHVRHWTHVLLVNIVGGMCEGLARASEPRTWGWAAWRVLRAFPWTPRRLLGSFNHKGRRCRIHPTATVEGCVLGDGVVIDAGAAVRGSILADGAHIGQHARVQWSVIGPGARVSWNGIASFAVLMRGSEISFPGAQMSVVGRSAWLASGAWHYDTSFAGPIRVRDGDRVVPTHMNLLGVAVGHGAVLGGGVKIAAGREIPNETRWIEDPAGLATRIPAQLEAGATYVVRDGRPVRLDGEPGTKGGG